MRACGSKAGPLRFDPHAQTPIKHATKANSDQSVI
jgi:hypothetical protein